MRGISAGLAAFLALTPYSPAFANCKCRAQGVIATEGQTLCIRTPTGARLARCGKVSNVSSWTFLDGPCPQAAMELHADPDAAPLSRRSLANPFRRSVER